METKSKLRVCLLVLATAWLPPVLAQSEEVSEASVWSVSPSVEAAAGVLMLLPAGSELVVQAVRPVGESVQLVLVSVVDGTSVLLEVGAGVARGLAIVAGTTLVLTAVSGGFVLSLGAEIVAFVPDALTRSLIHDAELRH